MFNTIVGAGAVGAASRYGSDQKMRLRLGNTASKHTLKNKTRPVVESLDRKYDFEPATGHIFFLLNMILLHLKIRNQPLNPQLVVNYVSNWINCYTPTENHILSWKYDSRRSKDSGAAHLDHYSKIKNFKDQKGEIWANWRREENP
jgi:hypothetical protein